MSREQYTPPQINANNSVTNSQQQSSSSGGGAFNLTGNSASGATGAFHDDVSRPVRYLCGDCDTEVVLKKGDAIRCKECGYRVLYKQRTNRMIQFEAR